METAVHSLPAGALSKTEAVSTAKTSWIWDYLEFNRFGFTGAILVVVLCFAGIAAAVALSKSLVILMVVGATALMVEVLLIAIAPMKLVMACAVLSILVDLFVFAFLT